MLNNLSETKKPNIVKPISLPKKTFDDVDKEQDGWDMFDDSAEDDSTIHQALFFTFNRGFIQSSD